jgi:hypothetical protein
MSKREIRMPNEKFQISNQCQNLNIKIWHLSIRNSIDIWTLKFVIKKVSLGLQYKTSRN